MGKRFSAGCLRQCYLWCRLARLFPHVFWLTIADDFDTRCWDSLSWADPEKCKIDNPCRSDCWSHLYSHSYCCVVDSPCWWWGQDASGDPIRTDVARTGVECRYLCQAQPGCTVWTFWIPVDQGTEAAGQCVLKEAGAEAQNPGFRTGVVVSGPRICSPHPSASPPLNIAALKNIQDDGGTHVFSSTTSGHEDAAAAAVLVDGWAVIRDALSQSEVDALRTVAMNAAEDLLLRDPPRLGNRGPRRYSFGGSSSTHHMVHLEPWAQLLDNAFLGPVLQRTFGGDYVSIGGGGDFVLNATDTHQRLHVDLQLAEMYDRSFPPPGVSVNVAVDRITCDDGPMRFVPRTQQLPLFIAEEKNQDEELAHASHLEKEIILLQRHGLPDLHAACPLEPGDVLIRDMRLWHGGTPNMGSSIRLFPSAEFLSPWYADLTAKVDDHFTPRPVLPFSHWLKMSPKARNAAKRILSAPFPVDARIRDDFVLLLPYVAEDRP